MTASHFQSQRPGSRRKASVTPEDVTGFVRNRNHEDATQAATVLAVDPGGVTGWALFCFDPKAMVDDEVKLLSSIGFWACGEYAGDECSQVDRLESLARAWPNADVVVEDFILRQFRMDRTLLAPVRITAAFKQVLRATAELTDASTPNRSFYLQQPNLAMSTVTDDRLKRSGFYAATAGKPHARDAVRHALTFARRKKAGLLFQ